MANPRIFIGVPCYQDVAPELLEDWCRWFYHLGRRMPDYDFFTGIVPKKEQFRARNAIVDAALSVNADWLLMLDDDMIVNPIVTSGSAGDGSPDEYGFLAKLLAHDKDICGALYYQRTGECAPVLMTHVGDGRGYRFLRDDEITHGLQPVAVAGGGCLLIKTRVFDRLPFPYFEPEFTYGTDIQLCRKATEKGYEVWADTSIELGHLRSERVIVTSRNRAQFQLGDTLPGEVKKQFITTDVYQRLVEDACAYTGYPDLDTMTRQAQAFLKTRHESGLADAEWYRQFPNERIARQVWYNLFSQTKKQMTEYILSVIDHHKTLDILDFGCGIGIPAFTLAEKGHRVTAMDIRGTGTFEFLKARVAKQTVPMTLVESEGGVPDLGAQTFDVVIAMDCLEHIEAWPEVVKVLGAHLKPMGIFFANNAILDDTLHPEHYTLDNKAFIQACVTESLMPFNQITYVKRAPKDTLAGELTHA